MAHAIFFNSVHPERPFDSEPKRITYLPGGRIAPSPVYPRPFTAIPLGSQIAKAVENKSLFFEAMKRYTPSIRPLHSKSLCKNAYRADMCLDGIFCKYCGNLAELYAHNIAHNIYYKTKPCAIEKCKEGLNCPFGHQGDLMREIFVTRSGVVTKELYIQK